MKRFVLTEEEARHARTLAHLFQQEAVLTAITGLRAEKVAAMVAEPERDRRDARWLEIMAFDAMVARLRAVAEQHPGT